MVRGYEDNLGEPLRAVREDVEKEWVGKLEEEVKKREEKEAWASELVRQLEKEKKVSSCMLPCFLCNTNKDQTQLRTTLEDERRALASFVSKFDSLSLGGSPLPSKLKLAKPTPGGASAAFAERQQSRAANVTPATTIIEDAESSPALARVDFGSLKAQPSLLDQKMPDDDWSLMDDVSFEMESVRHRSAVKRSESSSSKENIPF